MGALPIRVPRSSDEKSSQKRLKTQIKRSSRYRRHSAWEEIVGKWVDGALASCRRAVKRISPLLLLNGLWSVPDGLGGKTLDLPLDIFEYRQDCVVDHLRSGKMALALRNRFFQSFLLLETIPRRLSPVLRCEPLLFKSSQLRCLTVQLLLLHTHTNAQPGTVRASGSCL